MAKRSIEEIFRAITPRYRRGIPEQPAISAGFTSGGGQAGSTDLSSSLSQAGQQIAQLQQAYQQQAALIGANTQAIQGNTSAQGNRSGSAAGQVASNIFGGALGFISPVISGIASLFGGHSSPVPVSIYTPPSAVSISGALTPTNSSGVSQPAAASTSSTTAHVTVNITAMDSQSFMDRSTDIANAVREAMLNMHPINNVIANL
jgi:hypothetical protein